MAPVLRPKHTLRGKSVTPLIKRLRDNERIASFARLARDVDMADMEREDLVTAIKKLTGEAPADLFMMAGKMDSIDEDDLRILLHHTITVANELGQPLEAQKV